AALSLLAPSAPTTDSWGWIVWGREVADLDLNTDVGGSPAWKPLPVMFTLVFSLVGDAAPELWLWLARAGGLLAVAVAFRLASRLAGPWAGAVAAVALLLAENWIRSAAHGYSEGLVAAAVLLAFERHIEGRGRAAWGLMLVAALARPEAWVFLVAYTLYGWRRGTRDPRLVGVALVLVPLLWLGADWWGSGDPFHAGQTATSVDANFSWHELLGAGAAIAGAPVLVLALIALLMAVRQREHSVLRLAGCVIAWTALVCGLAAAGGPGAPRFLMPAVAGACVLAGVGAVRAVRAAGDFPVRRLAVAAVLIVASAPAALPRAATGADQLAVAERRAVLESDLRDAVRAAAGPLRRCGAYVLPADLSWLEGAVAWELDVPLDEVDTVRRSAAVPAALAGRGPVLVLDQGGDLHRESLMSRASRRDRVLSYPVSDASPCLVLFSPLPVRPQAIGGRPARIQRLGPAGHWRAWAIRRSRAPRVEAPRPGKLRPDDGPHLRRDR
ncbi:MAG: hypothetical protein M3131_10190, partial [Actinomycetota bacterium]|nr:hypothetical protein [Actinomycetota bacterium]